MVKYKALEELDVEIIDGDRGKNYPNEKELFDDGYCLFLSAKNVTSNGFEFATKQYISEEKDRMLRNGKLSRNDIIITTRGTVGNIAYYSNKVKFDNLRINSGMLIVRPKNNYNTKYLYYVLKSDFFAKQIHAIQTGSAQPQLPKSHFQKMKIPVFEKKTQDKIAYLLSLIDERIDNNNKINKNLEEQSYAMITSKILNINNKSKKTLDEFCNIFTGKKNANKSVINGKYKFFTCAPEVLNIDSYIYDGSAIIISGNGAYTGRTTFYKGKFDLYQRTYACTIKENANCEYIYLLYWLVKSTLSKKISGGTHGSAIPYIVMDDIAKFEFSYDKNIFDNLSLILKANLEKILNNNNENEKLIKLRDFLLPKLMSGEIDVSKIDI